jgi:hypothetical protein
MAQAPLAGVVPEMQALKVNSPCLHRAVTLTLHPTLTRDPVSQLHCELCSLCPLGLALFSPMCDSMIAPGEPSTDNPPKVCLVGASCCPDFDFRSAGL